MFWIVFIASKLFDIATFWCTFVSFCIWKCVETFSEHFIKIDDDANDDDVNERQSNISRLYIIENHYQYSCIMVDKYRSVYVNVI